MDSHMRSLFVFKESRPGCLRLLIENHLSVSQHFIHMHFTSFTHYIVKCSLIVDQSGFCTLP